MLIDPHDLHELRPTGGTQREKGGLIKERKAIVRARNVFGRIALERTPASTTFNLQANLG